MWSRQVSLMSLELERERGLDWTVTLELFGSTVLKARIVDELPKEGSVDRGDKRTSPEPWHTPAQRGRESREMERRRQRGD